MFLNLHSVMSFSFKDLCAGRLRAMHQHTHQSRMGSRVVSLDLTLSESVWIRVAWDMDPVTTT